MRILNLIQCTNLGGMEQASLKLMRGLKARGHEVRLLSLNPIGQLGPLLEEAGIPHEGLPYLGKGGWRSYPLLKTKLREIEADGLIMTGHHLLGTLALGNFCQGHRVLAIHFHHTGVKPRWQWQLMYRLAWKRFNAITFPCDFVRIEAELIFPPLARLAHTVRNPLETPPSPTPQEKAKARSILNLPRERPIVGNAGWLIGRKRFDVFLEVARAVLARNPKALFVIAGDGPERATLESLARELGVRDSVRWLGWQREMGNFYKALDVLLFNSDWDAMGLTPLEAMAFGVPAVCSVLHGGLGEVLNSDDFGFLRATHDVDALARLVLRLLDRPDEAARVGLAGRERVQAVGRLAPIVEWHERALFKADKDEVLDRPQSRGQPCVLLENVAGKGSRQASNLRPEGRGFPASGPKKHVAVLFSRLGPYHFARLKAAAARLRVTAVEFSDIDTTYAWDLVKGQQGFERLTLFSGVSVESQSAARILEVVDRTLDRLSPAAVAIPGWYDRCAFAALRWCAVHAVPAIVMSETTAWDTERKPWRESVKKKIVRLCTAALAGGRAHADYLAQLGMPRDRIFLGYDVVDNDYFAGKAEEERRAEREERRGKGGGRGGERGVRSDYGLPKQYFLASARFVEKKNLARLIEAYAQYRKKSEDSRGKMGEGGPQDHGTTGLRTPESENSEIRSSLSRSPVVSGPVVSSSVVSSPWSLVLLGDGPLKSALCHLISDLGLDDSVLLPGFKQYNELPTYYGLASAFIHASTVEQWGLVVNEAMASGLPVLVSNRCGCAADLVREGVNGFTFDPYNVEQLAQVMMKVATFNFPLSDFGASSRQIIAAWGASAFGEGLADAVSCATEHPPIPAKWLDRACLVSLVHGVRALPSMMASGSC
jgi:glycosyltransferase involved in cell wall biosynthesis